MGRFPLLLAQAASSPDFGIADLFAEGYLYPVLALLAITVIIVGVLSAWRSEDIAGLRKAEMKREIILELRRQMVGMTGDALSRAIGLEPFKTVKLLEEM